MITLGQPCDRHGNDLLPDAPPPPNAKQRKTDDWSPYGNRIEFELADFLFKRTQISAGSINALMDLWAATLLPHDDVPPFSDHKDLHETIDSTKLGDAPWESFTVKYTGPRPDRDVPSWMTDKHIVWYHDPQTVIQNMLSNPDFEGQFDYAPKCELDGDGKRRWQDFMSGDWAWEQAASI